MKTFWVDVGVKDKGGEGEGEKSMDQGIWKETVIQRGIS